MNICSLHSKKACRSRDPISPAERLVVTLRYLASRRFQIPVFQLPYRGDHHFRVSRDAMFIFDRGTGAQQFKGLVMSETHRRRPRRYKFEFSFVGNSRLSTQKSGTRRENRMLPILQSCPRPSQTIGDIYDFEFIFVGKIWDSRENPR